MSRAKGCHLTNNIVSLHLAAEHIGMIRDLQRDVLIVTNYNDPIPAADGPVAFGIARAAQQLS